MLEHSDMKGKVKRVLLGFISTVQVLKFKAEKLAKYNKIFTSPLLFPDTPGRPVSVLYARGKLRCEDRGRGCEVSVSDRSLYTPDPVLATLSESQSACRVMAAMFQVCQGTCLCAPSPEGYGKGKVLYCYGEVSQNIFFKSPQANLSILCSYASLKVKIMSCKM